MKRTGFRKQSLDEIQAKQAAKRLKTPQAKKKTKSLTKSQAKLKKELDAVFSRFIRQKYPARCYTCGKVDTPLQCGHFVSRQYLATRWDENNCRPQCVGCNIYGNGKPLDFEENLKIELGNDLVEKMKASRHQTLKLDNHWYEAEIEKYKLLITP